MRSPTNRLASGGRVGEALPKDDQWTLSLANGVSALPGGMIAGTL
jgi:hypothetical protein